MEEKENNKYILGTIGAIIGAFVGIIPWLLIYIFGNLIVFILAPIIAIGSFYGYKLTKAKIDKKMPVIISAASIIAIVVTTFLIIPAILMMQEGIDVNFASLKEVYGFDEFKTAIIHDFVISFMFVILGISGVVSNFNKQLKEGVAGQDLKVNISQPVIKVEEQEIEAVKSIFVKYDALNKNNAIEKQEVLEDLYKEIEENRANDVFKTLVAQGIIKKSKGKFYFSEKAQNSKISKNVKVAIITMVITIAVIVLIAVIAANSGTSNNSKNEINNESSNTVKNEDETITEYDLDLANIKFETTEDMYILSEEEMKDFLGANTDMYKFVAVNEEGSKVLYCFTDDNEEARKYTTEEYLKESLNYLGYEFEIETEEISGIEFKKVHLKFEEEGYETYYEDCYIHDTGSEFLCFDFCYMEDEEPKFNEMIKIK